MRTEDFVFITVYFIMTWVFIFAANHCASAELNIVYHSVAQHSNRTHDRDSYLDNNDEFIEVHTKYNEVNYMNGLEYINGAHGLAIGQYEDSYNTTAKYVAALYLPYRTSHTKLGLMYGVIRSPSYVNGRAVPLVLPYLALNYGRIGVNLLYLPKLTSQGDHTAGLQFKYNIGV